MSTVKTIKIAIVSDIACPWCFIGKRRMETAIRNTKATNPNVEFEVTWHPYQLNPNMSKEPQPKRLYYSSKFGEGRVAAMIPQMTRTAKADGINLSYDGVVSNTFDGHRMIHWAKEFGKQDGMVEELFKAYHENEKSISDPNVLADAAENIGLNRDDALAYLESDENVEAVKNEIKRSNLAGINGVPDFTIQDSYKLSGAQEPSVFEETFEHVLEDQGA
ncbi:thioredoxin-like protein [Phycomyces nitens]|nr:thioredoxin-like protein [Phycomyces nitens]